MFPSRPEVIVIGRDDGFLQVLSKSRAFRPDLLVDLHGSLRSRMLSAALAVRTVRVQKRTPREMLTAILSVKRYRMSGWIVERAVRTVERATRREAERDRPILRPPETARDWARDFLSPFERRRIAAVAPGSRWFTKRWHVDNYAEVACELASRGYGVVAIGGDGDKRWCDAVAKKADGISAAGIAGLTESAALIERCAVLVGNDSLSAHLAVGVGVPTVTVFGSTIPEFGFAPHWERDAVIETGPLYCRPCALHGRHGCPEGHLRCLREVTVEKVVSAVERVVG
jgi:heptosyltransferase-2